MRQKSTDVAVVFIEGLLALAIMWLWWWGKAYGTGRGYGYGFNGGSVLTTRVRVLHLDLGFPSHSASDRVEGT